MKRLFSPYYLFILLATSVAMIFLLKINKQSFYHHYFRVIEDVEARNSQHLQDLPTLLTALEEKAEAATFSLNEWLSWAVLGLIGLTVVIIRPVLTTRHPFVWTAPTLASFHLRQPCPIRAP